MVDLVDRCRHVVVVELGPLEADSRVIVELGDAPASHRVEKPHELDGCGYRKADPAAELLHLRQ